MAKRKTYTYDDLSKMSLDELKKVKKTLRDSTTRKIRNLNKKGIKSTPAVHGLAERVSKGKVAGIKGLTLTKSQMRYMRKAEKIRKTKLERETKAQQKKRLIEEALDYQTFNQKPTSTPTGFKKYEDSVSQRLGEGYDMLSETEKKKFWELYEEYRTMIKDYFNDDSERIQQWLANYLLSRGAKRIVKGDRQAFKEFMENLLYSKSQGEPQSEGFGDLPPGW